MMIAQVCDLQPGDFIHTIGDAHLYLNHIDQVHLQLSRRPRLLPTIYINPSIKDIFAFKATDFTIKNYNPYPHIKAPIAV